MRYVPYKEAQGNNCLSVEEGDEEISVHIGDQLYVKFSRDKICPVPEKLSKSEKKKNQSDISALKLALLDVGIITKLSKYLFIPVHWDKRKAANRLLKFSLACLPASPSFNEPILRILKFACLRNKQCPLFSSLASPGATNKQAREWGDMQTNKCQPSLPPHSSSDGHGKETKGVRYRASMRSCVLARSLAHVVTFV